MSEKKEVEWARREAAIAHGIILSESGMAHALPSGEAYSHFAAFRKECLKELNQLNREEFPELEGMSDAELLQELGVDEKDYI